MWELDWDYEAHEPADWDEGARPYLENFIAVHTPYAAELPKDRQPSEEEIGRALTRTGIPSWTERDFDQLLQTLACAGYVWLHPEGVRSEVQKAQRQQEEAYRKDEERRRQEKEARRKAEEEAWNRSLRGRISNFFRGKKPGKR